MDKARYYLSQRAVRAGVIVAASALLVGGATWHGLAANSLASAIQPAPATAVAQSAPATTSTARVLAGGRDSYADVVKVVAPGVVTINVEGRAKARTTQFGDDDEDMLRRFFGDQFGFPGQGRGQRGMPEMPRTFR